MTSNTQKITEEDLAKLKKDHLGLFSKPNINHVTEFKEESRLSEILHLND